MKSKQPISDQVKREIEVRAYLIWESEGHPHGREREHWERAEAEILGTKPVAAKKTVRAKPNGNPATVPVAAVAAKAAAPKSVTAKAKKPAKAKSPSKSGPHRG